jgi:hypothetical protein
MLCAEVARWTSPKEGERRALRRLRVLESRGKATAKLRANVGSSKASPAFGVLPVSDGNRLASGTGRQVSKDC